MTPPTKITKPVLCSVFLFFLIVSTAPADVTYNYTGMKYETPFFQEGDFPIGPYTNSMRLTGVLTFSNPLPSNKTFVEADLFSLLKRVSFFDGVHSYGGVDIIASPPPPQLPRSANWQLYKN